MSHFSRELEDKNQRGKRGELLKQTKAFPKKTVAVALLPATTAEASVAMTGLCLSLILLRGLKRSPSLAMA